MKNKKILALAIAGATFIGAMGSAVPVEAEDNTNTTTVTLTVAEPEYILTFPAATTVTSSGKTELSGSLKISSLKSRGIVLTPSSKNDWKFVSDDSDSTIGYSLYDTVGRFYNGTFTFTGREGDNIYTEVGMSDTVGVDVDATDYENAEAGTYTDVITWTVTETYN